MSDSSSDLYNAVKSGNIEILKSLVEGGADVNSKLTDGLSALQVAANAGDLAGMRYLVSVGAQGADSAGLLQSCVAGGNVKCIGVALYALKADVNAKDTNGNTALLTAIVSRKPDVIRFLLEHGASAAAAQTDLNTALHLAADHCELDEVKMLIGYGADVGAKNKAGESAVDVSKKRDAKVAAAVGKELNKPVKDAKGRADDAARFKAHGNKVFAEGENVKAAKFYSQAIQNEPSNHVYFSNRAACQFNLRDYESAYLDACRCLALSPKFVRGYFRKAAAQHGLKDIDGAKQTIAEGLALEAQNRDLLTLLSQVNKN